VLRLLAATGDFSFLRSFWTFGMQQMDLQIKSWIFFSVCKTVSFSRSDHLEALYASYFGGKGGGGFDWRCVVVFLLYCVFYFHVTPSV